MIVLASEFARGLKVQDHGSGAFIATVIAASALAARLASAGRLLD
jgi:hypothetical protein